MVNYNFFLIDSSLDETARMFYISRTKKFTNKYRLEDTARYAGLLLAPAEDFGLWLRLVGQELIMLFWATLGNFWCPVVTLVTFSSNLSNFEKNP